RCQFESVTVCDGIGRTGLDTISAKNAAVVVDVVNLGITFGPADPVFRRVLCRFDIDAVGWAVRRTKKTGYAFLQAIFVALEHVHTTEPLLKSGAPQRSFAIGIVLNDGRL